MLAYLKKQASISCLLALLPLWGKEAIARDRSQDKKERVLLLRSLAALLSLANACLPLRGKRASKQTKERVLLLRSYLCLLIYVTLSISC
jgi:hypothetical protein